VPGIEPLLAYGAAVMILVLLSLESCVTVRGGSL